MTNPLKLVPDDGVVKLSLVAADALAARIQERDATNRRLVEENDRLEEAKLSSELRFSLALSELDERTKLRLSLLERRIASLADTLDRNNNYTQGLPTRPELEAVESRLSFVEGRTPV